MPEIIHDASGLSEEESLACIIGRVYDINADDARFRVLACADSVARGKNFEQQRKNYPVRREFRFTRVRLFNADPRLAACLSALQFQVVTD